MYLLDTNIPSDVIRNPQGCAATKIAAVGEENVATSVVVAAELRFGNERRSSPRLTPHFEAVLRPLPILLLDGDADIRYGLIRADLERRGTPIGGNDVLIAAHALSLGAMLVTINMPNSRGSKCYPSKIGCATNSGKKYPADAGSAGQCPQGRTFGIFVKS